MCVGDQAQPRLLQGVGSSSCGPRRKQHRSLHLIIFGRILFQLTDGYQALHRYEEAVKSWEQALEQLPKDNLSSSQQKQKEQYQALREQSALQMLEKNEGQPQSGNNEKVDASDLRNSKDAPWARARRLLPELKRQGITDSSVSLFILISTCRSESTLLSFAGFRHHYCT